MERTATMEKKSQQVMQKAKDTGRQVAEKAKSGFQQAIMVPEKIPMSVYEGLTLGSILASVGLFASKKRDAAIFVGLWAPTFLALGLINKLTRPSQEM